MGFFSDLGGSIGGFLGVPQLGNAAGSFLDGNFGSVLGAVGQQETNSANSAQAQANRDFQERMSSTSYQRAVSDMQAAGLSPMLAYGNGGASTPAGAQAVYQNPVSAGYSAQQSSSQSDLNLVSAGEALARTSLATNTANKVLQETTNLATDNLKAKVMIDNLLKEGQNLVKQNWNLTEVGNQLRASVDLMSKQGNLVVAQVGNTEALKALTEKQSELVGYDISAAKDMGNLGREMGQVKPIFDILNSIFRRR